MFLVQNSKILIDTFYWIFHEGKLFKELFYSKFMWNDSQVPYEYISSFRVPYCRLILQLCPLFLSIFTFKYASSVAMNFDCNCGGLAKHELEIPLWQFVWPKSKGEKEQRSTTHTVVPPLSLSLFHSHSLSPSHLQLSCVACHLSRFLWASLTWPKNIINFTQRHPQSAVATSLLQVDANSGRGKDMAGAGTQLSVHKISRYANQWYILYVRLFVQIALRYTQTSELRISFSKLNERFLL